MQINFHISNTYTAEELDIAIRDGKKVYWSPDHDLLDLQSKPKQEVYEILEGDLSASRNQRFRCSWRYTL